MSRDEVPRPSVAIIGAGWAGLACALKLARAGYQPIVFESASEAGGRARRAKLDDTFRDNGQHLMLAGCQALVALYNDIGLALPRVPFAYSDGVRNLSLANRRGRLGLLQALLTASFSRRECWSILRTLLGLQLRGWQASNDQTVAQWLQTQGQPTSLIEHFWTPLALAILNTPINQAAMARLAPVLRDTLGAGAKALSILQPTADLSCSVVTPLVNAIASYGGRVQCGQRVKVVDVLPDGDYAVTLQHSEEPQRFNHIVIAVPPWALTHIDLPFDTTGLADRFGSQPIATVYLGFDADVRLPAPLMQLAGPADADARVWAMDRAHCGEPGVIAVSLSADGPWTQLEHECLASRCLAHLQTFLGTSLPCRWHKVVAVHKATPAATPEARLSEQERHPSPGLWLTGDWTHPEYPATLEAAVATGLATAEKIIATQP